MPVNIPTALLFVVILATTAGSLGVWISSSYSHRGLNKKAGRLFLINIIPALLILFTMMNQQANTIENNIIDTHGSENITDITQYTKDNGLFATTERFVVVEFTNGQIIEYSIHGDDILYHKERRPAVDP